MTRSPRARLTVRGPEDGGALVVGLGGELDLAGVTDIGAEVAELLGREPGPVVVDLAEVSFCDSSGIAVLIRLANHFGRLRVRAATPAVRRVVEVLGLAERFGMDGD